jgi:two-component system sensor histidine kinase YesM
MIEKINDLLKQVLDEHIRKKDAEYKALQAQINPHFLYNTLNSIRWMAMIQKADNIKKVVDALGRLLRNCTSKVDEYICIREEIENLKDYIYIEKIAYKNKFQVEWDIDQEVLQYKCIKFILQPFVENSIFHGIQPKEQYGTIWISVKKQNDLIMFSIRDDGVGMAEEQVKDLLSNDIDGIKEFSGIGISNVNERIQMAYGRQGGIFVESKLGEYTNITIKIPAIE